MENLRKIQSPQMKQTTLQKYFSPPTNKLQDYKIVSSGWLSKKRSQLPKTKLATQSKSIRKIGGLTGNKSKDVSKSWKRIQGTFPTDKLLDDESQNSKTKGKSNSQSPLLLTKSESFETYGMILPSVDEILDNINKYKKDAKALEKYDLLYAKNDTLSESLFDLNTSTTETSENPLLDCKHLSKRELKKYFKSNLDYIRNIQNGVEYSVRHETFKNFITRPKLTYNTSTIVFSHDQTDYLLRKLEEKLDLGCNNTEYILMVLLPEMCLRIFMVTYDMSIKEAIDYLDWRPID